MKKILSLVLALALTMIITACANNDVQSYAGLNAEIIAINSELNGFTIKSLDDNSILGEECYINLESDDIVYIYTENETGDTEFLKYDDFVIGDVITIDVNANEVQNKSVVPEQIQLITQRIN